MVSYEKYSHNKLLTHMFPHLPVRAVSVADTNFVCGTQKMFLILFRNILWPQQMFPGLRSIETPFILCRVRLRGQETSSTMPGL